MTDEDYSDQFFLPPRRRSDSQLLSEMQALLRNRMHPEARYLIEKAIEAQKTGKMPEVTPPEERKHTHDPTSATP